MQIANYMFLVFFAAMAALWLLGFLAAKYLGRKSLIVFIGGDDDRLSLSKAQAFSWTLIIMSSYLAAMAVHKKFLPSDPWIEIPEALLALAGIVFASGVFSSVISAVKEEKRTAEVSSLSFVSSSLTISGIALGRNKGAVRIVGDDGKRWDLSVLHWDDQLISVGVNPQIEKRVFALLTSAANQANSQVASLKGSVLKKPLRQKPVLPVLIVDTQNGKACYRFDFDGTTATLREPIIYYEFIDFFRDDQNPSVLSIMKYQMFAWTVIAIVIYTFI